MNDINSSTSLLATETLNCVDQFETFQWVGGGYCLGSGVRGGEENEREVFVVADALDGVGV